MRRTWLSLTLVLCSAFAPAQPYEASPVRTHEERITAGAAEYTVHVGGVLDMDNTMTRAHGTRSVAFQNNLSITLANTGGIPVQNPRVVTNGERDWRDIDHLLAEFTTGAETDQDRVYLIWEHMRQNRHHDDPLYRNIEFHDPVRWLNVYGGGLCDDAGMCGSALYRAAGFTADRVGEDPFVRHLHGHMQCEVFCDGDFQFMDIDQDVFFLDRENRRPVSGDALARDHDLARREMPYGPLPVPWDYADANASLFGIDDDRTGCGVTGHVMDYTLRPGERIAFRWDNVGKYAWNNTPDPHRYYGNSKITYEPGTVSTGWRFAPRSIHGFDTEGNTPVAIEDVATVDVETRTCYAVCGVMVTARFEGGRDETRYSLALSRDGENYTTVWEGSGATARAEAALDDALGIRGGPPCRTYRVRITVSAGVGARVEDLRIETDITASPMALPRLRVGDNRVTYSDVTAEPHEVTVLHAWSECYGVDLPDPPEAPLSPAPGSVLRENYPVFKWPAVEGCDAYWIRVSRRPDLAWPFRPSYDLIVGENRHSIPRRGLFRPDETYYWAVRPRLAGGAWGAWSPVWTFAWEGPMVPRDVACHAEGDAFVLTWTPNPDGTRPVRYDVYGSDERGFPVYREAYEARGRGRVPHNFLGGTTVPRMVVATADPLRENMNKACYRVVAVDENGVESCPSDFAELPRPHVFTSPVTTAVVGQPYTYRLDTFRSIGDFQHRYPEPGKAYWEREAYTFDLLSGPGWLALDPVTGLLHGTPGTGDTGAAEVVIRVTTNWPEEVPRDGTSGPSFQKRRALPEDARSCEHRFTLTVTP